MKKKKDRKIKFEQKRKLKKIMIAIISFIITICVLYNVLFLINTTISQKDYFHVCGISFFRVKTDLMENDLHKNDFVIVKEVIDSELQVGDIIAYEVNDQVRINKIVDKKEGYTTKFNQNYYPDIEKITMNEIIGKKIVSIPFLGIILDILQSKIISILVLLFLMFIFWYNTYTHTKRKERERKKKKSDLQKQVNL